MEILKYIENVDHTNEREMFSLNEKVYEWLLSVNPKTKYGQFVFSRDALKSIRPEGWKFCEIRTEEIGYSCRFWKKGVGNKTGYEIITEELAELHAIIQAIEYERTKQ